MTMLALLTVGAFVLAFVANVAIAEYYGRRRERRAIAWHLMSDISDMMGRSFR